MALRVGVCGAGRIGRSFVRALSERSPATVKLVALADVAGPGDVAYLLEHDTVRGRPTYACTAHDSHLTISDTHVSYFEGTQVPDWHEVSVDLVIDATGTRTSRELAAEHLERGAGRVVVSAPCEGADRTVVFGYNHELISETDVVLSAASCTTNCVVHMLNGLRSVASVDNVLLSTVHSYTADQRLVDSVHTDRRRGRAAAANIIPTSTGAARASGLVIEDLIGRIDGRSYRVPVPDVSLVDLVALTSSPLVVDTMLDGFASYAAVRPELAILNGPLVSSDLVGSDRSCTIDGEMLQVSGKLARVVGWYDNEWGYSNRLVDICDLLARA